MTLSDLEVQSILLRIAPTTKKVLEVETAEDYQNKYVAG